MTINKQIKVVRGDNSRFHETEPNEIVELFNEDGTVFESGNGSPIIRAFPFTFDTENILTGASLYTPKIGDLILDAWLEISQAWNGTTPLGDFGTFTGAQGLLSRLAGVPADMTGASGQITSNAGLQSNPPYGLNSALGYQWLGSGVATVDGVNLVLDDLNFISAGPLKVTDDNPIKICVSQDGTNVGADPVASQGSGVLYLVTVTPI